MNIPLANRFGPSLVLLATALLAVGCGETKTPTEPAKVVLATPTPRPSPAPTPIPQPADMSGKVTTYSGPIANVIIECQGRSTTTTIDGAYVLTGLMSGVTVVTVHVSPDDVEIFDIELKPGTNTVNLFVY